MLKQKKISVIASEKSWIEGDAIHQLKKTSELKGIIKAVGLPDLHPGKGIPVGASFISKDIIYPHIIGNDIGCGMTFVKIDMPKRKVKIDKWVKKLQAIESLTDMELEENLLLSNGIGLDDRQIGSIGSGNHFAEFQEINEIFNQKRADDLQLDKKSIYLLVHSGSRGLGESILGKFLKEYDAVNGLDPLSPEGKKYLQMHDNAILWAKNNRKMVIARLLNILKTSSVTTILSDLEHNSITKVVEENEGYYIHRKGAAPGNCGETIIAGSRGSLSFFVDPIGNSESSAFSLAHGAGRKWKRSSCKDRIRNKHTKDSLRKTSLNSWVVCRKKSLLFEEAPEAYKNIEQVIGDLENFNLIDKIASFKPLLTYKS